MFLRFGTTKDFYCFSTEPGKQLQKKNAEILNVLFLLSLSAYHLETILASVYQAKKASKSTSKVSVRSKWSRSQELFDQYFGGNKCYKSDNFAAFAPQLPQETVQNNKRE